MIMVWASRSQNLRISPPAHHPTTFVAAGTDQDLEDLALVVDGTPQIHLLARDPDDHFVEMPAIARSRTARSQAPRDRRSEFEHPTANALVGDVEPAFGSSSSTSR